MTPERLEAFSDGVFAIIITIMVLELHAPHSAELGALTAVFPHFVGYVLSFVYLGIYWNNHHHMFHVVRQVSGGVLWANLHLLFWLSLVPFFTAWMGETHFAAGPTAAYGVVLFLAGGAYWVLQQSIIRAEGPGSLLKAAIGKDWKGKVSPVIYLVAIPSTAWHPWIAGALYVSVAVWWLVPDARIERIYRTGARTEASGATS
jgi:uncharacterized membrane protein